ncbi:MAG: hypothetical protein ABW171_08955 [Steroidobacter sp.]
MINWRELLGLKPTVASFAQSLIDRARARGDGHWRFDPDQSALRHPSNGTINLTNIFLEYSAASGTLRKGLLGKYEAMMQQGHAETPKLWELAGKHIYPVIRCVHDGVTLEIATRTGEGKMPRTVSWPLAGDLMVRLVFDRGESLAHVQEELADTWGQSLESLKERALKNLASLPRPQWQALNDGVHQVVSDVSYEESFLLVNAVVEALPFASSAVLMATNRGVLLACDGTSPEALRSMLGYAERSLRENPWPMAATMLHREAGEWREFIPTGELAEIHASLARLSIAITYNDQQAALQKHLGDDIFVGTYSLIKRGDGPDSLRSWSSWTKDVPTLLPQTDLVVLGRPRADGKHDMLMVPWPALVKACGGRMKQTAERPARFMVEEFPSDSEWQSLAREGEMFVSSG